jgi:transposase InsO family protein
MKVYPITVLCKVMEVSRSGFYDYLHRLNTDNADDVYQNALKARIKAIFNESKSSYGSRRVLKKLQSEGYQLGRYKVRRLMRDLGLRPKRRRRYKVTTDSRHSYPVAANVLDRKFDIAEDNRVWGCDITYV